MKTEQVDTKRFSYTVSLKLGYTYSPQFKEFYEWCQNNLGSKYKDWCIVSTGKRKYALLIKDSKWGSFLALKYSDIIDI